MPTYKKIKLVIVVNGLAFYGGATKPIFNYYKYNVNRGYNVQILDITSFKGAIKFILAGMLSPRIAVNGLAAMDSWMVLILCLLRKGIILYCHEAEYAFNAFAKYSPMKYRIMKACLAKTTVACVSQWQSDYIARTFKTGKLAIVYNNIDLDTTRHLPYDRYNVVMLGYLMHRKGVDLFSKVADMVAISHPEIKFTWIGSGSTDGLYCSPKVDWIGEVLKPEFLLQQCDMLLLSAMDDPFPLACLEALAFDKKCVVYKNTGTAEVIREIGGCAVYDDYTPEAAYAAMVMAINTELDKTKVQALNREISSVESFVARMDELIMQ